MRFMVIHSKFVGDVEIMVARKNPLFVYVIINEDEYEVETLENLYYRILIVKSKR